MISGQFVEKAELEQSLKTWQQKVHFALFFTVFIDLKKTAHFCPSTESLAKWPQISRICSVTSNVPPPALYPSQWTICWTWLAFVLGCLFVCFLLWVLFYCVCDSFVVVLGLFVCLFFVLFCCESVNVPIWSILMPTAAWFCKINPKVKGAQTMALIIIPSTTITFYLPKFYIMQIS